MPEKNRKQDLYATSTVGMSIYNLLASTGRTIDADGLCSTLERIQLPGLEQYLVERALGVLVDKGLVVRVDRGYRSSTRQIIMQRDDGDFRGGGEVSVLELILAAAASGPAGGGTLDDAYDYNGPGLGRTITADSGSVRFVVPDAANNAALELGNSDVTNHPTKRGDRGV